MATNILFFQQELFVVIYPKILTYFYYCVLFGMKRTDLR